METIELRIGNYVSIDEMTFNDILDYMDLKDTDIIPNRECLKVTGIDEDFIRVKIFDEQEVDIKDINPIKLTERWLNTFRF